MLGLYLRRYYSQVILSLTVSTTVTVVGIAITVFICSLAKPAYAESSSIRQQMKFFTNQHHKRQLTKSTVSSRGNSKRRSRTTGSAKVPAGSLAVDLRPDTAEEFIFSKDRMDSSFAYYKGLAHLKYLDEWVGIDGYNDVNSESVAQNLLVYRSARVLVATVKQSPALAKIYRGIVDEVKAIRNYTTLGLKKSENGGYQFAQGRSNENLMEFKLSINAKRGIEPAMTIKDNVSLRYNLLDQVALFQFQTDF